MNQVSLIVKSMLWISVPHSLQKDDYPPRKVQLKIVTLAKAVKVTIVDSKKWILAL